MKLITQNLFINPPGPGNNPSGEGIGISGPLDKIVTVGDLVSRITQFLIPVAALILFFVLISGGYDLLMSQGNPEKLKSARAKITAGVIGFVLMIASYMIVKLISSIFGLTGTL